MALSGTLKDFGISDILQLIGQQQKAGILKLEGANDNKVEITFANGTVVFASEKARDKTQLLGSLLRRAEMITDLQLEEALEEQQRTLKRLGDILVSHGLISELQLSQLARLQATETLYRLFHWKTGTYEFTQGDIDVGKTAFEPLRAESILLEGYRRVDEWGPLRKRIPSNLCSFVAGKELLMAEEDPGSTDVGLAPLDSSGDADGPGERHKLVYRLALAEPGCTAERIIDLARLGEFETLKALEKLMSWGFLKMVDAPKAQGGMRALTQGTAVRARGMFLQIGVTVACLLAALFLVRLLVPALVGGRDVPARPGAAARVIGHDQLLRLESALEVYRLEHGEYPDSLAKLLEGQPLLAESDLRWPYRVPYHYRRTQQGFVLLPPLD